MMIAQASTTAVMAAMICQERPRGLRESIAHLLTEHMPQHRRIVARDRAEDVSEAPLDECSFVCVAV